MTKPKLRTDVSVGEYDPVTGLTYITHQRGRLLFHMGASAKKQPRREPAVIAIEPPFPTSSLATGTFTGLSLYPEEAHYLMRREALVIYLVPSEPNDSKALSIADFTAILASDTRVSLACLEVYTFLKDQNFHPRRCLLAPLTASTGSVDGRSVPRHLTETESCDVAFDVWRTVAVHDLPPQDEAAQTTEAAVNGTRQETKAKQKKKKKKTWMLGFRVAVARYSDAVVSPQSFRQVLLHSNARDCGSSACNPSTVTCDPVPVKVAVVHHDQSVLMFEISD